MSKVHFIPIDSQSWIAFFPDSCRFFKTNLNGKLLIESVLNNLKYNELSEINISNSEYDGYYAKIQSYTQKTHNVNTALIDNAESSRHHLDRLVIHVSNDCNLRCKYCYAAGGAYGSQRKIMNLDMVYKILERFYSTFDSISSVQIFGGEPLYNMAAIRTICEYVRNRDQITKSTTKIGLVTNATLISDDFIKLVRDYNISVTVSYDGTPIVNDLMRTYTNGFGTSKDIIENTRRLYKMTGQPDTIEVTYNRYHIENNISILDVIRHVKGLFPNSSVHLVPVCGDGESDYLLKDYNMFPNSIDEIFKSYDEGQALSYSLAERIFIGITRRSQDNSYICNAGIGTLSVSIDGDIYPCFMFTNEDALRLGNISDDNVFFNESCLQSLYKLATFNNKTTNSTCRECFMRSICNGCLGLNATHIQDDFKLNDSICDMFRRMTERVIIHYVLRGIISEAINEKYQ